LIVPEAARAESPTHDWLDLERAAEVEITSEDAEHPIEAALAHPDGAGWRAAGPGEQLVRIVFDEPQQISRIRLVFEERTEVRTQEFVLRWSTGRDEPAREIVRQQWNFHPHEATREVEVYRTDLADVRVLELGIKPDINGGPARATLRSLQVA
jgi:hypothetical protein